MIRSMPDSGQGKEDYSVDTASFWLGIIVGMLLMLAINIGVALIKTPIVTPESHFFVSGSNTVCIIKEIDSMYRLDCLSSSEAK